ncbi:MAG: Rne/Rng family ribonuclease [Planctomycetes bacterium]|nr:Rne/Rng family ribonuclease [Planctomycetota bacterium]
MTRKIFMNVAEGDECRIAVMENGRLFEYFVDRPSQLKHVGNIYKGIINNIEPGIQASFVDVGLERNGFLHISDINYAYENSPNVKDLFSRTLRVKEQVPEDAILNSAREREVEEVADFVSTQQESNGKAPEEAQFLDSLDSGQPGHRVSDSPLNVAMPEHEVPGESRPVAEDSGRFAAVPAPVVAPTQPATSNGSAPSTPVAGEGEQRRRRRRRGRRGRGRGEGRGEARADGRGDMPRPAATEHVTPVPGQASAPPPPAPATPDRAEPVVAAAIPKPELAQGAQAAPEAKAKSKRSRRRRTPKQRGGHLPRRVLDGSAPPQPNGNSDAGGTRDIDGKPTDGGSGGVPGPQYRYHRGPPKIQNILKRNQEVVVQVTKASQGGKGPGLSTFISLPGRYMVLTPSSDRGGVSRKIEDGGARNELRKMLDKLPVPEGMGVIIRTAAIDRSYDDLLRDLNYLLKVWSVIVERIHEAEAPALLYTDSDPAIRAVRDYFTAETEEIVIDNREVFDRVVAFFDQLMPSFRDRVKLYEDDIPLFFANGLESQIEHIFDKKVTLKSGGYLFIEQTEALISIDVNSGKFTGGGDAEKTAYLTNMEAIPEICRQLRLRDLGGIVCNDFIDMMSAKHRSDVENLLKRELRKDRARTKVARFSPFGVMEMTRQRVRPSIKSYTFVGCPTCGGFGMVRSAETSCLSLIRRMKLALVEERVKELAVQVHPHVLSHLHSEFRDDIDELEENYDKRIVFEYSRDLDLGQSRFFYVGDRGVRVLYDMDQRINTFVKGDVYKSRTNVAVPEAASGSASPQAAQLLADADSRRRKRRRGGKKQREREQERMAREQRIKADAGKAVTFGDKLPDQLKIEVIREAAPAAPSAAKPGESGESRPGERRGRRGRRGGRGRAEKVQSGAISQLMQNTATGSESKDPPAQEQIPAAGTAVGNDSSEAQGEGVMAKKKPAKKKAAKKAAKKPAMKPAKKKPAKKAAKKKAPAKKPVKKKAAPKASREEE